MVTKFSVASYIQELQRRAIMLDADHKKLFETIKNTNELIRTGQASTLLSSVTTTTANNNVTSSDTNTTFGSLTSNAKKIHSRLRHHDAPQTAPRLLFA